MKNNLSEPDDLRIANQALLDENASLRQKLEELEATSSAKEGWLQTLASQIKLGFWEWDEVEDCATYYSKEIAKMFGVSQTELYERFKFEDDFFAYVHPDDVEHYRQSINRGREYWGLPGQTFTFDYRIIRPDGQIRHLRELEYGAIRDKGTIIKVYGAVQDITDHQEALTELKQIHQRYSSLLSQLPIGVQEVDYSSIKKVVDRLRYEGVENLREYLESHPKILREMISGASTSSVNETLVKMYLAESEQHFLEIDEDIDEWWSDEWVAYYAAEIDALAGPDKYYEAECVGTRVDGSLFDTRSTSTLVRGCEDSWSRVITIHEDITDRKRNEIALIEAKSLAEKASMAKSEFLSSMSHEL